MKNAIVIGAVTATLGLTLVGCSTSSYSKDTLAPYFNAIASEKPGQILDAKSQTAPGSNAENYVIYMNAIRQAQLDAGNSAKEIPEVVFEPNSVSLCRDGYKTAGSDRSKFCSTYSNFKFADGKLADFNAGDKPLEGRISLGTGKTYPIQNMGSVKLLASYFTIAGDLAIVTEFTSTSNKLEIPYSATYLAPNGRQIKVSDEEGVDDLKNGRTGNVVYYFAGAEIGGVLELPFEDSDWKEFVVSVPTK